MFYLLFIIRVEEKPETYEKVVSLLKQNSVEFEEIIHPPVKTSAEVLFNNSDSWIGC